MTTTTRTMILRANATWLMLGALGGLTMDLSGAFFARGPVSLVLRGSPDAAIGLVEAHGLALICSVLLWRAAPTRVWHLTGAAVHTLLGTANLVFWQMFVGTDMLLAGCVTTGLHILFVVLQLSAALSVPRGFVSDTDFRTSFAGRPSTQSARPSR
jgi:hypothetical protein